METQIWCLLASSVQRQLRRGIRTSASTSVWEKAAPPALTQMQENSVPTHMSLVLFELRLQCWSSEQVSPVSLCRPFRKNTWDLRSPLSHSATIPAVFYSQTFRGTSLPGTTTLGFGASVELGPLTPEGEPLQPSYPSTFLSATRECEIDPFCTSMWLHHILNCRTSVQLDFRQF